MIHRFAGSFDFRSLENGAHPRGPESDFAMRWLATQSKARALPACSGASRPVFLSVFFQ